MGVSGRLLPHGAQPEAFGRVEARSFEARVVEDQRLGAAALQEELAVVSARHGVAQAGQGGVPIEELVEGAEGSGGHRKLLDKMGRRGAAGATTRCL
jgi:hypothetical protein